MTTLLYGMEYKPDVKQQKAYEKKRQAAIKLLGDKYLLAKPIQKKGDKDEKFIANRFTNSSIR